MVKDYYYIARYSENVPGTAAADGVIIMPCGIPSHTLIRRRERRDVTRRRLFDPQLYLGELQPERCRVACAKLASYPWFMAEGLAAYDSGQQRQAEWSADARLAIANAWRRPSTDAASIERAVASCINFQRDLECEAIILPSPLTREYTTDYGVELAWLEIGLREARRLAPGLPAFASIAISDSCLRHVSGESNQLLELIVDAVSTRASDGAYIVLEQATELQYYCTSQNTVSGVLRLARGLKAAGLGRVIVSYAGVAGFVAALAGADAWATGWRRSERRLRLVDFEDEPGGQSRPTLYSHALASEIHLRNDLTRIASAGLFEEVADLTPASESLLSAIRAGRSASDVVPWQDRRSNVTAAREHFALAMIREAAHVGGMDEAGEVRYGRDWLSRAAERAERIVRVGNFNPRTELSHQRPWRDAFVAVTGD